MAARRRCVRGRCGGLPGAALVPRRLRPRRLDRRQPAQVAVHADGLLGVLVAAARRAAGDVRHVARLPRLDGRRRRPEGLRAGARPPLPGAEAVVRAADVRRRRAAGGDPRARPPRAAVRVVGRGRAGLGGCRAASVLDRVLPSRRQRQLRAGARRDRDGRAVRRRDAAPRTGRDPPRDRQRPHRRGRRASSLGGAARRARGDLRPLGDADRLGPGGGRTDGRQDRRAGRARASATAGTGSRTATSRRFVPCSPRRACRSR